MTEPHAVIARIRADLAAMTHQLDRVSTDFAELDRMLAWQSGAPAPVQPPAVPAAPPPPAPQYWPSYPPVQPVPHRLIIGRAHPYNFKTPTVAGVI